MKKEPRERRLFKAASFKPVHASVSLLAEFVLMYEIIQSLNPAHEPVIDR
jgi:hypothetical protein